MVQTYEQWEQGEQCNQTEELARFLIDRGYAVLQLEPQAVGPKEFKPTGPSEIKTRKTKKNHGR